MKNQESQSSISPSSKPSELLRKRCQNSHETRQSHLICSQLSVEQSFPEGIIKRYEGTSLMIGWKSARSTYPCISVLLLLQSSWQENNIQPCAFHNHIANVLSNHSISKINTAALKKNSIRKFALNYFCLSVQLFLAYLWEDNISNLMSVGTF